LIPGTMTGTYSERQPGSTKVSSVSREKHAYNTYPFHKTIEMS